MIQPVKEKIILGIDPGTNIMGYGVLKVTGTRPQVMTLGVIDLRKCSDPYLKLKHIYERVQGVITSFYRMNWLLRPRFRENVQSMLNWACAGSSHRSSFVSGYSRYRICTFEDQMAITGNGQASKEQVADMLKRMLHIPASEMGPFMDATDALAAAYCHYLQMGRPELPKAYSSWKDYIAKNPDKVKK